MTENEILFLKDKMKSNMNVYFYDDVMKVFDEVIAYRAIGTVDECRAAMERMKPKKAVPDKPLEKGSFIKWRCPNCGEIKWKGFYYPPLTFDKVCTKCFQVIDWSSYMKFDNGNQMYDYLTAGRDLYSKSLGVYAFEYNDAHAICTYSLQPEEVVELIEKSNQTGEYWGAHLGIGGSILDDLEYNEHRYSNDEAMRSLYLKPSIEFCEETYNADDWMDVNDVTVEYVMSK